VNAEFTVMAGSTVGAMLANVMAAWVANRVAFGNKFDPGLEWVAILALPALIAGLISALVGLGGLKLAILFVVPAHAPAVATHRSLIAAACAAITMLVAGAACYGLWTQAWRWNSTLIIFLPGFVESLLSTAAICLTLLPFCSTGFMSLGSRRPALLQRATALATLALILSGVYAQYQSESVDWIGSFLMRWMENS